KPKDVRDPGQFDGAFAAMVAERAQGLIVVVDPLTVRYRGRIVELAAKNRVPAVYGFREFVDAGGLMAYGVNVPYLCRRAAGYVDKILKGAKPGELPVEQPTTFELIVSLKTAKALGLSIPTSLLARADEVIQSWIAARSSLVRVRWSLLCRSPPRRSNRGRCPGSAYWRPRTPAPRPFTKLLSKDCGNWATSMVRTSRSSTGTPRESSIGSPASPQSWLGST